MKASTCHHIDFPLRFIPLQLYLITLPHCRPIPRSSVLESVPPAPLASQNPTLPAFKNIKWKLVIVLFILVRPGSVTPIFMSTIMAFSKIGHSLVNLSLLSQPNSRLIVSFDLVRSSHQTIFVPLGTRTGLPELPANITVEVSRSWGNRGGRVEGQELRTARAAGVHVSGN